MLQPILILDLKAKDSVCFALIVSSSIRKGNTEQLRKTQCLDRENVPHPNESGTRCRSSGLSAKVVWTLQNLVSY